MLAYDVQKHDESSHEISLLLQYDEIKDSTSAETFDKTALMQSLMTGLPPPSKFKRPTPVDFDDPAVKCCSGAIISLVKPHKFLSVSTEFLNIMNYEPKALHCRGISILFGPNTDPTVFNAAIKDTALLRTTQIQSVLYTCSGA